VKRKKAEIYPLSELRAVTSTEGLELEKGHPILDSIADGVFTVDMSFRITSFNRAAEEITGYRREEAIGRPCSQVFRAANCKNGCVLRRSIETGQQLVNIPVEIQNKHGDRIPISVSAAVLYNRDGSPIGGVETFRDLTAINELRRQMDGRINLRDIVGRHPKMRHLLDIVPEIATSDATVLIQGSSGSGKGVLAKAIHDLSHRADKPFVKVNCAALPENLLESELFGYVKGAFTDARYDKPGRIALAEGGTLFLDEIGDVPVSMQVKLLRMVQEREYEPLGGTATHVADVRIIAATNRDLAKLMQEEKFREDLFYRLNVINLKMPSLAERREDIPRLVGQILRRLNDRMNKNIPGLSDGAMDLLMRYSFPGNVRELENAIEHAMVMCRDGVIEEEHLPSTLRELQDASAVSSLNLITNTEAEELRRALHKFGGNRTKTAAALGMHRTTLWRKIQRLGLKI
jgi:PAS domain S-box-containing protein